MSVMLRRGRHRWNGSLPDHKLRITALSPAPAGPTELAHKGKVERFNGT